MTIVIAAAVWMAVIGLLLFRGPGERSTTYAAIAVGIGTTLNISPVYLVVDGVLGGVNATDLLANSSIIVGVFFLARGVAKAGTYSSTITRVALGPPALLVAIVVSTTAFTMIETTDSSTRFMIDYGDQLAAGVYSAVQHAYFGIVVTAMSIVCTDQLGRTRGFLRLATAVLLLGSVIQIVTCLDVIVMDVAHVAGNQPVLAFGQSFYDYLNASGFTLIALGLVLLPAARFVEARRAATHVARLVDTLTPTWERAVAVRGTRLEVDEPGDRESVLYRQLVEIRDAEASADAFRLSAEERTALQRAEATLLGARSSVGENR